MTDQTWAPESADPSGFSALLDAASGPSGTSFATAFRGYDRDEVDAAFAAAEERHRRSLDEVAAERKDAVDRLEGAHAQSDAQLRAEIERLEGELIAASARASKAEERATLLTEELVAGSAEAQSRPQFEEILRVAEEQAGQIIRNASVQGDRLLAAAREEIQNRRRELQAEAELVRSQAQHDAQQARLRIDTEVTAHQSQLEREAAISAERISQAEQEAAAIRSEAEKGAAALRSLVARETEHARAEAEEAVREHRVRALEFEESLTRRQDDAQQEFLVLHNQAVAHAERITQDANEQVAASLEHAQRVGQKADDFDKLMRAQAQQVEADAQVRARETLDRARVKAQKIIDSVTGHSSGVLRDAEDRARQLRWQQHQLTSFMAEVRELMRSPFEGDGALVDAESSAPADAETAASTSDEEISESEQVAASGADASHTT